MGAALGVLVGYVLGCRAGERGYEDLVSAWETIRESAEVKDLVSTGVVVAREMTEKAVETITGNLQPGRSDLRNVA